MKIIVVLVHISVVSVWSVSRVKINLSESFGLGQVSGVGSRSKIFNNIDYLGGPKTRDKLGLTETSETTNDLHGLIGGLFMKSSKTYAEPP